MGPAQPADWLVSHTEKGQTFREYLSSYPVLPTQEHRKIYVLPLGTFNADEKELVRNFTVFLEAFFGLPVEELPPRLFSASYPNVRENNLTHSRQTKTSYILNDVLKPILPADAAALIAYDR